MWWELILASTTHQPQGTRKDPPGVGLNRMIGRGGKAAPVPDVTRDGEKLHPFDRTADGADPAAYSRRLAGRGIRTKQSTPGPVASNRSTGAIRPCARPEPSSRS